jgi:hypothetical protein
MPFIESFNKIDCNEAIIPLEEYPELVNIENNKNIIIQELNNVIDKKLWFLYKNLHQEKIISKNYDSNQIKNLVENTGHNLHSSDKPEWYVFPLIYNGKSLEHSITYFPKTIELLEKNNYVISAGISCLEGGGYIAPHNDEGIERYKYHLPLIIPKNCGIKINNN